MHFKLGFLAIWTPLFCFGFVCSPAKGQETISIIESDATDLLLEDLRLAAPRAEGSKFSLELPDGLSCESKNGSPPSLNLYSGLTRRQNSYQTSPDYNTGGYAAGAVLSIPLGTRNKENCNEAYQKYIISKDLEIAQQLYELGLLEDDEFQSFASKVKKILLEGN